MAAGVFLSLDGVDGAGKSTHSRLLAEWLREQGHAVTLCRDPGGTPAGDRIRELLLDNSQRMSQVTETFLFMASRSLLVDQIIRPALARGDIVLADRFLLSTVVYQGHAGDLEVERIWEMGQLATGGVIPAWTFVLDLPVAAAQARKTDKPDRMESKGDAFFEQVRAGFLAEARSHPHSIRIVNANRPLVEIQADLREEVARVLGQCSRP